MKSSKVISLKGVIIDLFVLDVIVPIQLIIISTLSDFNNGSWYPRSPTMKPFLGSSAPDGGSNFTTATLTDSGYVTGSSGQRILTGQAAISGQPSGQSMRWKLALANNQVKIHGVSLQWS